MLFGSEIKALLASGLVEARPNEAVVPEVLSTRYVSGDETLFEGVYKLLPGHLLVFEHGEISTRQYLGRADGPVHHHQREPSVQRRRRRAIP